MPTDHDLVVNISANAEGVTNGMTAAQESVESGANGITSAATAMAEGVEGSTGNIANAFGRLAQAAQQGSKRTAETMSEMGVQAKESAESIETTLEGISKGMSLINEVAIGGAAGEALKELAEKTGEYGESIEHAAQVTGMSVDAIQRLNFAAAIAGVSSGELSGAMSTLVSKMSSVKDNSSPLAEAFKAVGISAADVKNMKLEDVLKKIADAFAGWEDGAQKTAIANQIFGDGIASKMIPMLNKGGEGIDALGQKAANMGAILGDQAVDDMVKLGEQMKEQSAVTSNLTMQVGASLTPVFMELSKALEETCQEGGVLYTVVDFLVGMFKAVSVTVTGFRYVLEATGKSIAVLAGLMVLGLQRIGLAWDDMLHHTSKTAQALKIQSQAFDAMQGAFKDDMAKMTEDYAAFVNKLSEPLPTGPKAKEEEKKQDAPKLGGDQKKASMMKEFQERLALAKEHFEALKLAQGSYQEWSNTEDLAFWEDKLKLVAKGSADERAIIQKIEADKLAITRQAAAQQSALRAEAVATAEKQGSAVAQAELADGRQRLALGQINAAQMVAIEKDAAKKIADLQTATLTTRLKELQKDGARNVVEIQKTKDQLIELEQAHVARILDIDNKAAQDVAKEQKAMADEAVSTAQALALEGIERRKAIADKQLADKQITNAQMIALEVQLEKETLKVEQDALAAKLALLSKDPTIDVVAKQKLNDQMLVLEQKGANDILKIQAKATDDIKNNWTQLEGSITSGMANAMTSIVEGTSTVRDGFKSMAKAVLGSVISMFSQIAAEKIKDQALSLLGFGKDKVEAGVAANAQITSINSIATANTTAATTSAASWATSATAQITSIGSISASHVAAAQLAGQAWAGVAGAAGVASFAAAPWPVDIGAPAFGAAMYASAASFSAEGGFDIPAGVNPVTQLHEKEMVLPAKQADAVREMANAANGKGGGNVNLHVHAMDAQSVKRLFENNGTALMDVIRKQRRNFAQ